MTTTPELPVPADAPDIAAVDRAMDERATTSAHVLSGIIAAKMLDVVGQPGKLPQLMWPDVDPEAREAIWRTALAVGFRAGKMTAAPRWEPESLDRLQRAMEDEGYDLMASRVARTAAHGRRHPHPADNAPYSEHP